MSIKDKTCKLIKEHPDYKAILKAAIQVENKPPNDFIRDYGWEWHHAQAHPGKLTKLVSEGIVKVTYKSRRYTHYKLADKEEITEALQKCGE